MAKFALRRADNQTGRVGQGRTAEQPVAARIPYSGFQYFVHGIGGFYGYNATKYYIRTKEPGLPNDNSFFFRSVHRVAFLDAECFEEGVEVTDAYINTVFAE